MKIVVVLVFLCVSATVADPLQRSEDSGPQETQVQLEHDDPTQNLIRDDQTCQPDVCKMIGEMGAMATRLAASEKMIQDLRGIVIQQASVVTQQKSTIEELKSVVMEQSSMLSQQKSTMEEQKRALAQQSSILSVMGSTVEQLSVEVKNRPKVAFSASLYSSGEKVFGPFPGDTNLAFRTVFTNVGNAYSPTSGIFEAPVKGVYYFRFTAFGVDGEIRRVSLLKNGQQIVTVTDNKSPDDKEDGSSNAAVLELEQGDEVHLVLRKGFFVYDDGAHHTTFSGFLLFSQG